MMPLFLMGLFEFKNFFIEILFQDKFNICDTEKDYSFLVLPLNSILTFIICYHYSLIFTFEVIILEILIRKIFENKYKFSHKIFWVLLRFKDFSLRVLYLIVSWKMGG